jgi:hypothetical protein
MSVVVTSGENRDMNRDLVFARLGTTDRDEELRTPIIGDLDFFRRFVAGFGRESGSRALPFLTILTKLSSAEGMECPVATTDESL